MSRVGPESVSNTTTNPNTSVSSIHFCISSLKLVGGVASAGGCSTALGEEEHRGEEVMPHRTHTSIVWNYLGIRARDV